ncbi:MAG: tetratricopeptide repeat protein [Bacteroidetes bacterium]|nr:MAG: tetratricopeptide repeat protein [Bacteroidota bacterium]
MKNKSDIAENVGRKEFEKLIQDPSRENLVELDDFDQDALEGWNETGTDFSIMKNADLRFKPKFNFLPYVISLNAVILIIAAVYFFNGKSSTPSQSIDSKEVQGENNMVFEKNDIALPEIIDTMTELPVKKQILAKHISAEFKEIKQINDQKELAENKEKKEVTDGLDVIQLPETPTPKLVKEVKAGKEIYIEDLKVLDYRAYRSKPTVTTKQMDLSGTPANLENNSRTEEEPVWKDVEIPYIDYLRKTMSVFADGNNKKALGRFETILAAYPNDVNALFYGGLCYYNLQNYTKAAELFDKLIDSDFGNFSEEAKWYLAKSLLNTEPSKARKILNEIIEEKGFYAKQAEELLK